MEVLAEDSPLPGCSGPVPNCGSLGTSVSLMHLQGHRAGSVPFNPVLMKGAVSLPNSWDSSTIMKNALLAFSISHFPDFPMTTLVDVFQGGLKSTQLLLKKNIKAGP